MTTHYELSKQYSEGETKGTGSRMFIEGNTIYSYGHHFPIAVRIKKNLYYFNSEGYSSSTAKHKSYVLGQIEGTIINLSNCDIEYAQDQLDKNEIEMKDCALKMYKAKKEYMTDYWHNKIMVLETQNRLIKQEVKRVENNEEKDN